MELGLLLIIRDSGQHYYNSKIGLNKIISIMYLSNTRADN